MKKKGSVYYGKSVDEVIKYALGHLNKPKYANARVKIATQLEACRQKGEMTLKDAIITDNEGEPPCLCLKTDGSTYKDAQGNTKQAPRDADGNCITDDPSCYETTTTTEETTEETTEGCKEGTDVYNKAKS